MSAQPVPPAIQPIEVCDGNFVYQLDAPLEDGGKNLWSGMLAPNNGYATKYAIEAARLLVAAPDLLAALQVAYTYLSARVVGTGGIGERETLPLIEAAIKRATGEAA